MRRFRIEVGKRDKANVKNIVGAIANEADIDSEYIGTINILDNFSTVDLPDEMPSEVFDVLKNTFVAGRKLEIAVFTGSNSKKTKPRWDSKKKNNRDRKPRNNKGRSSNYKGDKNNQRKRNNKPTDRK